VLEIAGLKASGGVKDNSEKLSLIENSVSGKENEDEFGFRDLGEIVGSKYYKPSISDLKLLKGTK